MRILFSMRHPGALRNFASTLQALAERNHRVHLVFGQQDKQGDDRLLRELTHRYPNITAGGIPGKSPSRFWGGFARAARFSVDYVRYLTPDYEGITGLTERARSKAPRSMRWLAERQPFRTRRGNRLLTRALLAVERAIPIERAVFDLVRRERPDVLLTTPLVDIGSGQVDYVKVAQRLGVRTALPVLSWDNLTNKGLIRVHPDRVFVWNDAQRAEAVGMHGIDPEHVIVTGAMVYDQWFARQPSSTRQEFCSRVGLDPAKPILLYVCSSPFIAPDELDFITEWIAAVRCAPDASVRTAGILVRPHPENLQPWYRLDDVPLQNVAVWPQGGVTPVDAESKNDFFDSMYHAACAVGINTSAQIECAIAGRPVFSIRTSAYQRSQDGTLHFRHLAAPETGLLRLAGDLETHVQQLASALGNPEATRQQIQTFVRTFARPFGLDVAATPRMVAAIEQLGATPRPRARRPSLFLYPLRALLSPVAAWIAVHQRVARVARKRQRQLRPITAMGTIVQTTLTLLRWLLRAGPIRDFGKQHVVPWALSRLSAIEAPTQEAIAVRRMLHGVSGRDRPVIVGPWVSEVGFELLYWIPFLQWVKTHQSLDPDRLIVVSRGGCAAWYRDIAGHYVDLFDYLTPEQFRARSEQRMTQGRQKPRTVSEFDRDVLKLVRQTLQLRHYDLLHPTHMYRLFQPFWTGRAPVETIEEFARFQALPAVDGGDVVAGLPDEYLAVRFYFNDAFPETDANRRFVARLLDVLAESTDIVVLNPSMQIDDRRDATAPSGRRIHRISHLMSPRTNLEVQTAVISRARAFVGTYGGLSYLPPLYGVKSLSFYSDAGAFAFRHLELARRAFTRMHPGSYLVLDVADLDTLRGTLGAQHEAVARMATQGMFRG